ncbi:MAG: hypothetical protein EXR72_23205 [Myxococcales bacterium]|nr:hypothetical protein [Myxococcales bacterium]
MFPVVVPPLSPSRAGRYHPPPVARCPPIAPPRATVALALSALLSSAVAAPASAEPPHLPATRTTKPPTIDGRLDDPAWREAAVTDRFTQKLPVGGKPPGDVTRLRVLYDDEALYFAFDCPQRARVIRRLTRRDRSSEADWVGVAIDTRRDGTSAFEFIVNAAGVLRDGIRFNDTDYSPDWDENWEGAAALTDGGWSAELRIPLRALRFDRLPEQSFGLQARRYVSQRQELDEWSFNPRSTPGEVSRYGRLDHLLALRPGRPLELRPFVLGRIRRRDPVSGVLASGLDYTGSAGLDLKWHMTQNLTLDVALSPDFAQVEVDSVVLNLTTFETFFAEKRPFFLEGIDTFSAPLGLLYTRRIGRAPRSPSLREGEELVDLPDPTRIWAAAKLVGTASRITVGALSAFTGRDDVRVLTSDGTSAPRIADPYTLYNALRLKIALGENAHLGLTATSVNRFEQPAEYPILDGNRVLCPGGAEREAGARCFRDAYAAGLDARLRSGDYVAVGQAIFTAISGGPTRDLPDGTTIGAGDLAPGGIVRISKDGGKHWVWHFEYEVLGRHLDYNDLGYMQRQNQSRLNASLGFRTLDPWWKTLESHTRFEFQSRTSLDGLNLQRNAVLWTWWRMASFWQVFTEVHYRGARVDDREVGDGTALERAGLVGYELSVASDPRKAVSFDSFIQIQRIFDGWNVYFEGIVAFRFLPQLELDLLPQASWTTGEPRHVGEGDRPGEYRFGKLAATSAGATLRGTYTFTPRLTLQVYAQLFLASGHYSDFSSFESDPRGPRPAIALAQLRPKAAPDENPDFQEAVLNLSVVLRWEYLPGSTLFAVYTRAQTPETALASGESGRLDIGSIRHGPAADVLLLKLSYWWG